MGTKNLAGLIMRAISFFMDFTIFTVFGIMITYVLKGEYDGEMITQTSWILIFTLYLTSTPLLWGGYSIGKRICRIKVMRIDNNNVKISNMILREIVGRYLLGLVTFGISAAVSFFMVMFREDRRAIHDIIGGTYVSNK